jgi:hypothetical protein
MSRRGRRPVSRGPDRDAVPVRRNCRTPLNTRRAGDNLQAGRLFLSPLGGLGHLPGASVRLSQKTRKLTLALRCLGFGRLRRRPELLEFVGSIGPGRVGTALRGRRRRARLGPARGVSSPVDHRRRRRHQWQRGRAPFVGGPGARR